MDVCEKIQSSIDEKLKAQNFYEAHQLCRTLSFRYKRQNRHANALHVLYYGAKKMLSHHQVASAVDLSTCFVDYLLAEKCEPVDIINQQLAELYVVMGSSDHEARADFVSKAIKWASGNSLQCSNLYLRLAQIAGSENNYSDARHFYLLSDNGIELAELLVRFHRLEGYPAECDLLIAQTVLQLVSLTKVAVAKVAFQAYVSGHPLIVLKRPPFLQPLLNFIYFLLIAVEQKQLKWFSTLVAKYEPSIKRDPTFVDYLNRISSKIFGIREQRQMGFLNNLLHGILQNDPDEEYHTPPDLPSEELD